ncbi:MBL fold metallo-hydrolase [Candidatus Parcubacteria bacterium]|nr:MBL fold metallo-hydrolase [Candidatus Parcubacteria bacterium]
MKNKPLVLFVLFIIVVIAFVLLSLWHLTANYFFTTQAQNRELIISFLDIGQGDAALIKTPAGHNILIDGGPGTKILEPLSKELSWYDKTIDLMILTHPHSDHVDGLIPVLKRYEVKQILGTGVVHSSPTYLAWLDLVREQNIPLTIVDREQIIDLGSDCYLQLIYPLTNLSGREVSNLNNSSIVARLIYKDTSFLFMGDAEIEVEQELVSLVPPPFSPLSLRRRGVGGEVEGQRGIVLRSNVLKAGHHGSDTSSSKEFLDLVKPEFAIISSGIDNSFGHPSRRVIKRLERIGASILRTDELGTIRIRSDGKTCFFP